MDNVQHLYPAISDPINDQMRIQDNVSVHPAFGFSGTPPSIPQTHDSLYPTAGRFGFHLSEPEKRAGQRFLPALEKMSFTFVIVILFLIR